MEFNCWSWKVMENVICFGRLVKRLADVQQGQSKTETRNNRWFSRYVIAAMLLDGKQKIAH